MNLAAYKWPKLHEHVVEECRALDVRDVLGDLDAFHRAILRSWNPPAYPRLTLIPRRAGPFKRWFFECPRCRRPCETLFVPPGVPHQLWRCRVCWGLVYARQRYGHWHPLRKRLTRRKQISLLKRVMRSERRRARWERERFRRPRTRRPSRRRRAVRMPVELKNLQECMVRLRAVLGRPGAP